MKTSREGKVTPWILPGARAPHPKCEPQEDPDSGQVSQSVREAAWPRVLRLSQRKQQRRYTRALRRVEAPALWLQVSSSHLLPCPSDPEKDMAPDKEELEGGEGQAGSPLQGSLPSRHLARPDRQASTLTLAWAFIRDWVCSFSLAGTHFS